MKHAIAGQMAVVLAEWQEAMKLLVQSGQPRTLSNLSKALLQLTVSDFNVAIPADKWHYAVVTSGETLCPPAIAKPLPAWWAA